MLLLLWWLVSLQNVDPSCARVTEEFPFLVTKLSPYYDR